MGELLQQVDSRDSDPKIAIPPEYGDAWQDAAPRQSEMPRPAAQTVALPLEDRLKIWGGNHLPGLPGRMLKRHGFGLLVVLAVFAVTLSGVIYFRMH